MTMYCSNCGNSVNDKLKYCNSCGVRIAKNLEDLDSPAKMLDGVLDTIFWTAGGSLGILIGLVAVLMRGDVPPQYIAVIAVAYLATVFGISFTLLRQVPKLIDARLRSGAGGAEPIPPVQLKAPTTAQLEEYRQPASSVIDQTTRSLDEVTVKRD